MPWNRRAFLTTSSLALAGAFRSGPLFGQEKPLVGTFKELRNGRESLPTFEDVGAVGRFHLGSTVSIVFDEPSA